jgi:hypothetical protein
MAEPRFVSANNFNVITFCELAGFMFALPAGDALYRREPLSIRMIAFAIIGLSFVLLGPNWPWLKSRNAKTFIDNPCSRRLGF